MTHSPRTARDAALSVLTRLRSEGHRALFAGGCVRDMLLGRPPKDFDVATDATPERVGEIFPRANHVGAKFGVMLVRKYGHDVEIATFRADGDYSDGRHPDEVRYSTDREDAARRDFTVNGLFFDPIDDTVIDYVGGRSDLEAGVIRTIGDPTRRLTEDHLRMLRAVRFASRLAFQIDPATAAAIKALASQLASISPERVWMELTQILGDPSRAVAWGLLTELGLCDHLAARWPVDQALHPRIIARLAALGDDPIDPLLGMAAILCDDRPAAARHMCKSLRQSNREIETVTWLVRSLPLVRAGGKLELADLKGLMANAHWPELVELLRADLTACREPTTLYDLLRERASGIPPQRVAPPPLVSGDRLSEFGIQPGPRFGEILRSIYRAQQNETISTVEEAVAMAKRLIEQG